MGYKIYAKTKNIAGAGKRFEQYDGKTYPTRQAAIIAYDKQTEKFNRSKMGRQLTKGEIHEIRSVPSQKRPNFFGLTPNQNPFGLPRSKSRSKNPFQF